MKERSPELPLPEYQDTTLTCEDCGHTFIFTAGEQQFFYSKGLATPKRCQPCRKYRKAIIAKDGGNYGR